MPGGIPRPAVPRLRSGLTETPAATTAQNFLDDVSCFHAGDCVAVGGDNSGDGGNGTPVTALWNGLRWKTSTAALPKGAGGGELYGITCVSGGCVAVGYYYPSPVTENPAALVEVWNGSHWTLPRQPPLPGRASGALLSVVSCQTTSNCIGVGYFTAGKDTRGLIESWVKGTWHDASAPAPSTDYAALGSISCPAAGTCVAVGTYAAGANDYSLADKLSGGKWHQLKATNASTAKGDQDVLQSVSCPSVTRCEAVGTAGAPSGKKIYTTGYAEGWNGSTWSPQKASSPAGTHSALFAVACPTAEYCLAVGGIGPYATYNDGHIAAEVWTGSATWSSTKMPTASGGIGSLFYGDSCLAGPAVNCIAAGEVGPVSSAGHGLSGFWKGTTWKLATTA